MTEDEIRSNLEKLESCFYENTGRVMPKYFRFPEGRYDERTISILNDLGYKSFFWSLAYADWDDNKQPNSSYAVNTLVKNTHPGAIILLHPTSRCNAEILPTLIEKWLDMGYTFETLDKLVENK